MPVFFLADQPGPDKPDKRVDLNPAGAVAGSVARAAQPLDRRPPREAARWRWGSRPNVPRSFQPRGLQPRGFLPRRDAFMHFCDESISRGVLQVPEKLFVTRD